MYIVDFQDKNKGFSTASFITLTEAMIYARELAVRHGMKSVEPFSDKTHRRYECDNTVAFMNVYHEDAYK